MGDADTVKGLESELALVQKAIDPEEATKQLRDFMDSNSNDDHLAGTAEGVNPWLSSAPQGGGCCVIA